MEWPEGYSGCGGVKPSRLHDGGIARHWNGPGFCYKRGLKHVLVPVGDFLSPSGDHESACHRDRKASKQPGLGTAVDAGATRGSAVTVDRKVILRRVLIGLLVLAVLWVAGTIAIYRVMLRPPEKFAAVMAKIPGPVAFLLFPFETLWMRARAGTLQVGDQAPDFSLMKLDHSERIQLSSFATKSQPVVLVFGSYT